MPISLSVLNKNGLVLASNTSKDTVCLTYDRPYEAGDSIQVQTTEEDKLVEMCLDNSVQPAILFLKDNQFLLPIPFDEQRKAYAPFAFEGKTRRLIARTLHPKQACQMRNLAHNPYDHSANQDAFPHVTASSETRGEAAFAASNVIDGEIANSDHGYWPYTSWGINKDPNATLTVHFGRRIMMHELIVFIRADFPHDSWWQSARICGDDGWSRELALIKTGDAQLFSFEPFVTDHLIVDQLKKADDPSPFPSLSQLEIWGTELPSQT